ncbi:hypothetical protein [Streptomyces sp. NPDC058280]|uniref:hypothetical protein n=1 Tax=Streptomyces sp. NPDC058280 TaxID=3346419 RepID=UPI0036ED3819
MKRYFYVITIGTHSGPVSVSNTLHAAAVTTAQRRYEVAYAEACEQIGRASGADVPEGAPTLFYTCEPDQQT